MKRDEIYNYEQFIIGDILIEVWDGKTGWKWQVSSASGENSKDYPASGWGCLGQTEGLLMALAWLTRNTLREMSVEDEELYIALYPGLHYAESRRKRTSERLIETPGDERDTGYYVPLRDDKPRGEQ